MSVTNSESDSGSVKEEILLQHKLIESSKTKSKSNSKKLPKSPDSPSKNKMLKTEQTKKRLQLKKVKNESKSDSEDSEKELEIMKSALKQIKEKKAKGKIKTGSTGDNETKNDITLKLSDSTIMPLTTSTPNINSKLIQAASLSTKKGVLQKILADSNNVVKNLIKQGKANTKSNAPTKQLKGILKTSLQNIKNNQSDDSDSSSDKLPPSQWQSFQKKELEGSSDSEASFSNAISSTQIPQSQKSFDSDNGKKAQPVANRRQSITKNVSFDEDNDKQNPKPTNGQSSSDTSSSESEDQVDTTTVTNMKQIQKNEPMKTIFANTKSASDSDSDNNLSKTITENNMLKSAKSSSEDDSSESEDKSSTNEVIVKPNNTSASKNEDKSSSEDESGDNEKIMNKNAVNTGAKSVSDKVSSDSGNKTKAKETSSSADESSDSESSESEMRKDKSVAQKSKENQITSQYQSRSSESSSDSDEEPQNSPKKQANSFISQHKLNNFPQAVFQQKNILNNISGSDNESSSDISMNEAVKSPNKSSMQRNKRQREEISASESSDDEPKKRVSKLCDLSIVDTEPLLNTRNSETMYNSLKEYIITNPELKKINAKTNLLLEDLTADEEVWLMQCPKVLAPNLLVGQKLKLDKNVKLKMKVGSNKYECISERSNDLNICVVASESAQNQNLAAKIVKPAGTIVIHQMLKEKSAVRIETPDRTKVEAPANLKTRHPIFGVNYENKIKLDDATHGKLITAELERRKAEKKALKKKRRESASRASEKDTSINKDEIIYQLLNQTKSSINGPANGEKKKSKKRKLSESKEENITKVQKIDNIEKSEVDSPTKQSSKAKRKPKKSLPLSEDIVNDNKLLNTESVIENLLETTKMQMKSSQSAEKSKKKKNEKFSNNEKSIVNESEADSSNSTGKKNRKKNKNKEEAKLEGIKANVDEYITKSNETKLESILANISDTMISDTTLKKKHKKNKHKDENITMESQTASQIEKSLDDSRIFEYQQNVYNGASKKSPKKNKNKNPEPAKPSTDDTVTYSKVENITEIINNFSTISKDSTSKKKHKKKKNKDKSVKGEETSAFNDSTKLSVGNEELNVNNKSKKKHTNKNKSVDSINDEEEEMKHFTPKKNYKHVEESHDKSLERSTTSITKKKSNNKSSTGDNFDKNQVINDLLSSIMQNTNGHSKDKSRKQKRQSSDNIEKQIANVNEQFVEVKHKKKSKKKHDKD